MPDEPENPTPDGGCTHTPKCAERSCPLPLGCGTPTCQDCPNAGPLGVCILGGGEPEPEPEP